MLQSGVPKTQMKQYRERERECKHHEPSHRMKSNAETGYFEKVERGPWVSPKRSKEVRPIG